MAVFIFLLVLFVLILVHEWGHFIVAKKTGMRVDEFGIGFPPKLYGVKKGETEYTFNLFPIGGFVKIFGEDGGRAPSARLDEDFSEQSDGKSPSSGQLRYEEDGGTTANVDYSRSFASKSKWSQAAVLIAGVTMNILFAWLLYVVVFMVGVPTSITEEQATDSARLIVAEVVADTPAAKAGIPLGGEITGVQSGADIDTILYPSSVSAFIEDHEVLEVTYIAGGETNTVTLQPEAGIIEDDPTRPAIGVAFALVDTVEKPFFAALYDATITTGHTLQAITVGLSSLIADSVRGQADFSQVAGPVGIVGLVGDAAEFGFTSLLLFTAVISLNLAVINLLPFPALDGGRLVFVAIEAVTRRPINPVWVMRLNTIGFALLILLMVAVTYNDILRIL